MWIKTENRSFQVIEVNIVEKEDASELWVKLPDKSTRKVFFGNSKDVNEQKEAIEYAIENKITIYEV